MTPIRFIPRLVRHSSTKILPDLSGVNSSTTLGELSDRLFFKYKYRLAIPVVAWVGFLYYNFWNPYEDPKVKAEQKARIDLLKSLVYKDQ
ncbi:hypothetical protein HK103_007221 [Boothiomyces macroporosus]|uniref:Uncharacterized protein n=1 Tax=Boothiomyces macroporosus TaxID=261099 RepID=A0AAD5Y622_9FUNG|nr:hypothetical protein HK103_007221 [Boothiomyces macroporosus]